MVKRARPIQADESTPKLREEISHSCATCQIFSAPPQRFRVSLPPSDVVFNREVAMDLMWIDKKALFHVVDLEENFSSATFLPIQTEDGVWSTFISCWTSPYIGFLLKMRVDEASAFKTV